MQEQVALIVIYIFPMIGEISHRGLNALSLHHFNNSANEFIGRTDCIIIGIKQNSTIFGSRLLSPIRLEVGLA